MQYLNIFEYMNHARQVCKAQTWPQTELSISRLYAAAEAWRPKSSWKHENLYTMNPKTFITVIQHDK